MRRKEREKRYEWAKVEKGGVKERGSVFSFSRGSVFSFLSREGRGRFLSFSFTVVPSTLERPSR